MALSPADLDFFRQHGYIALPGAVSPADLRDWVALFDNDRTKFDWAWRLFGGHQTINCDPLITTPGVDAIIRHPPVIEAIEQLLGGPSCFSEICLRHMAPYDGNPFQGWHRDKPHWMEHPLRTDYLQLMVYLTDVGPETHCFSLSPEAVDQPILANKDEQIARGGVFDLHGPAGTAVLFNISAFHTATVRKTKTERKTVQIYYGHRDRPALSNDSAIPATLWRSSPDPETRGFYGNINLKTRLLAGAFDAPVGAER
ncbi:MAG: phytanoyl-CoA dioxygenase family protein [Planctomycetota bacterium]|nr:phytanoyl-CoA dioxygenase family protein [Planctomycetota bacterium]